MKEILKKTFNKNTLKKRLPFAILGAVTPSFMFFFFGILEMFAGNRDELKFAVGDFGWYILAIAVGVSAVTAALIMFLPGGASDAVFGVAVWIALMGYVQALFLNGTGTLDADTSTKLNVGFAVFDAVLWIAVGILIVTGAFIMQRKNILKRVFIIALIMLLVMQITGCVTNIGDITKSPATGNPEVSDTEATDTERETMPDLETPGTNAYTDTEPLTDPDTTVPATEPVTSAPVTEKPATDAETTTEPVTDKVTEPVTGSDEYDPAKAYLTKQGLDQVSTGKNVVIFLIDRFDVSFYQSLTKSEPDFFKDLDGFTYFSDNISLYSRTYPGVATMITGVDIDFNETNASQYFTNAYKGSSFLRDLKNNGYRIKLYTQSYYCYREGTPLIGVADNISVSSGYTITSTKALVGNLISLSAYRYLPTFLKEDVNISTASFNGIVKLNGTAPQYEVDDPSVCEQILENGLSFDEDGNSYIFIHLNGCHSPYNMDENCRRTKDANSKEQLKGCFKMIYHYIEQMKLLGVYDDSTIIITGDHPRARDDAAVPGEPRITALFAKAAGDRGELRYSSAQVSQENLIPTIIKSAGISTEHDYGRSYFEISEDEDTVRYHKFQLSGSPNQIVTFKITGRGDKFKNWSIDSRTDIGSLYR